MNVPLLTQRLIPCRHGERLGQAKHWLAMFLEDGTDVLVGAQCVKIARSDKTQLLAESNRVEDCVEWPSIYNLRLPLAEADALAEAQIDRILAERNEAERLAAEAEAATVAQIAAEARPKLDAAISDTLAYERARRLAERYGGVESDPIGAWLSGPDAVWELPCPGDRRHKATISVDLAYETEPDWAPVQFDCEQSGRHFADPCEGPARLRAQLEPADMYELLAMVKSPMLDAEKLIIPGTLAVGDRLILTGREGDGKSELLRQWGYQVAAGVNPFTLERMTPRRVLYVNLEISEGNVRDALAKLLERCPAAPERGMFVLVNRPGGIDLLNAADASWLKEQAKGFQLVVIGPLRKLTPAGQNDDGVAKSLCYVLDELRTHAAVMVEAHQTKGDDKEPAGSSFFMAWPEFGLHLNKKGQLAHWRGSRLPEQTWPEQLSGRPPRPGKPSPWPGQQPWPWVASTGAAGASGAIVAAPNPLVAMLKESDTASQAAELIRAGAELPSVPELQAAHGYSEGTAKNRRRAVQAILDASNEAA